MTTPSILIVEDEQIVAAGLKKRLQEFGYAVPAMATSGPEAIELAGRMQPDLVLMDIRLEGQMDGIEAAGQIRSRFRLPIVYLTAYSNPEVLNRAKITEPFGYILKPYQERELHVVIETALYKHRMERKLRERERWFVATLTSIGDGVVATDETGHITFMNPMAEILTGWTAGDALGLNVERVFHLVHEETRVPMETPLRQAMAEKRPVPMANHAVLVSRNAVERPIEDCASPILDDGNASLGGVMVFRDVTERKVREALRNEVLRRDHVERELRHRADDLARALGLSEEKLRQVIQSDLIGIISWDDAGNIQEANDAFLRLTGHRRQDLVDGLVRWSDFVPEDRRAFEVRALREIRARGSCTPFETLCIAKDGRRIPVLVGAVLLQDRRDRGVAFVLDLSGQKQAERQVKVHVEQLRLLAEAGAHIHAPLSQEHVLQVATERAREIVGAHFCAAIITGRTPEARPIGAVSASEACAPMRRFRLDPGHSLQHDSICRRARPLRLTSAELQADPQWKEIGAWEGGHTSFEGLLTAPLLGQEGQPLGLLLLSHKYENDFTESDQAIVVQLAQVAAVAIANARLYTDLQTSQDVLSQKEKHLRAIIETSPACIKIIAADGTLIEMNASGLKMVQVERVDELIGHELFHFVASEYRDAFRDLHKRVGSGQGGSLQYEIIGARGRRLQVETRSAALKQNDGTFVHLSITQDLSERHRLQEAYLQAQKMEAVGRLAGGIAHDFNNLLTVINGYSEILQSLFKENEQARDLLNQIIEAGHRAAGLTQQLLAYSRRQHQFLKLVNLNELLMGTGRMLRRMIGEDIEIVTKLEPELGFVRADPNQIDQVIMNLAVNAKDAMPTGGTITIETRNVQLDGTFPPQQFKIPAGPYVRLTVSDSGAGMDPTTLERAFEPFFTTKEVGKGTGLGLATVYGIVKQSGGYIHISSELGHGSSFAIYLPALEKTALDAAVSLPEQKVPEGTETILIAEDEIAVRVLMRSILQKRGYHVFDAANGKDALKLAADLSTRVDLLITDVVMPKMSGAHLVAELRKQNPGLAVLYVSGYAEHVALEGGLFKSESTFLQKPFSNESLAIKVRTILDAAKAAR